MLAGKELRGSDAVCVDYSALKTFYEHVFCLRFGLACDLS